jgi:hypothetical protein
MKFIGLQLLVLFIMATVTSCTKVDTAAPEIDEPTPVVDTAAPEPHSHGDITHSHKDKPHGHKHIKIDNIDSKSPAKNKAITPGGEDWKKWQKVEKAGKPGENKIYQEPFGAQPSPGGAKIEELENFENSPGDTRE